jgi:putative transposase
VFRIFVSVAQKLKYSAKMETDMTEEDNGFDFKTALEAIKAGKPLSGKEGILAPLIKNLAEAAFEGELYSHLGQAMSANRRNGKSEKTIQSLNGNFALRTPRDREGHTSGEDM